MRLTEPNPGTSARPRVLILVENNSVPADRRVWNIATALARADAEVVVVCPEGGVNETASYEVRDGVQIHRFPLAVSETGLLGYVREYGSALAQTWRLVRRLSAERPFDIVHACNPPDFLMFAGWPARRDGARLVFDHHDLTPELFLTRFGYRHRWLHRLTLAIERLCLMSADAVLAVNDSYRAVAVTRGHKRPEEVFVVRNGPDLQRIRPTPPAPALKRGHPVLLAYVGMMAPQDGVDHALRALAQLKDRHDWYAIFAGAGVAKSDLERSSRELGLADRVEFPGWIGDAEIARLLSTADVCLAPEPRSPLNDVSTMIKIAEYMAMSRPVVAYALRESQFTAGDAAVYATPNDVSSYAARIQQLLDDPARRDEMGRLGRARVEEHLSWEHSIAGLAAAYGSLLNGKASALNWSAV